MNPITTEVLDVVETFHTEGMTNSQWRQISRTTDNFELAAAWADRPFATHRVVMTRTTRFVCVDGSTERAPDAA